MKYGIIGVTGLIGKALALELADRGEEVVGFSRTPGAWPDGCVEMREWGEKPDLSGLDAVVNLAGFPVTCRWTAEARRKIRESRIDVTRSVVEALAELDESARPKVFVCGTAIGIYGDRGDDEITEDSEVRLDDFLGEVVRDWEVEAWKAEELGVRTVCVRTGMVLGKTSEGFVRMKKVFSMGGGGRLGSGKQFMAWIHLTDLARMFVFALDRADCPRILNGTAPEPVRNTEFTKVLGHKLERPTILPVPGFALRLMFGGFGEWLLKSSRVLPRAALDAGFEFQHPRLDSALADLLEH